MWRPLLSAVLFPSLLLAQAPQPIPVPPIESPGGFGLGVDPLLLALGVVVAAGAFSVGLARRNRLAPKSFNTRYVSRSASWGKV